MPFTSTSLICLCSDSFTFNAGVSSLGQRTGAEFGHDNEFNKSFDARGWFSSDWSEKCFRNLFTVPFIFLWFAVENIKFFWLRSYSKTGALQLRPADYIAFKMKILNVMLFFSTRNLNKMAIFYWIRVLVENKTWEAFDGCAINW